MNEWRLSSMIRWFLIIILMSNIVFGIMNGFDWLRSIAIVAIIIALGMEWCMHGRR